MKSFLIVTASLFMLSACSSFTEMPSQKVTMRTPGAQSAKCSIENPSMRYTIYTNETLKIMKTPHDLVVTCVSEDDVERSATIKREIHTLAFQNIRNDLASSMGRGDQSASIFRYPKELVVSFVDMEAVEAVDLLIEEHAGRPAEEDETRVSMTYPKANLEHVKEMINPSPLSVNGVVVETPVIAPAVNPSNLATLYNPSSSYVVSKGK